MGKVEHKTATTTTKCKMYKIDKMYCNMSEACDWLHKSKAQIQELATLLAGFNIIINTLDIFVYRLLLSYRLKFKLAKKRRKNTRNT